MPAVAAIREITAIIQREGDAYVALCPELDVANLGDTIDRARQNLLEAVEGFLAVADEAEIAGRLHSEVYVTRLTLSVP